MILRIDSDGFLLIRIDFSCPGELNFGMTLQFEKAPDIRNYFIRKCILQ